jgi:hypothetical protein
VKEDAEILSKLKDEELPESMQKMTLAERQKCVNNAATKRAERQQKIGELNVEREKHLAKQRKLHAEAGGDATLGDAVAATVRKQLAKSGFEHDESGM